MKEEEKEVKKTADEKTLESFMGSVNPDDDDFDDDDDDDHEEKKGDDDKELDEDEKEKKAAEEERIKNKNAEEARKRREAEAKEKQQKEKSETKERERENKLGEELMDFKRKYPDIDLEQLDKDSAFKRYIDGQLLGKKNFTVLYEEFVDLRKEVSGKSEEEVIKSYRLKEDSSSGSSKTKQTKVADEVYSEDELDRISQRIPLMSEKEFAGIQEKFDRSLTYHKKN